jgi:hypothetical protein
MLQNVEKYAHGMDLAFGKSEPINEIHANDKYVCAPL